MTGRETGFYILLFPSCHAPVAPACTALRCKGLPGHYDRPWQRGEAGGGGGGGVRVRVGGGGLLGSGGGVGRLRRLVSHQTEKRTCSGGVESYFDPSVGSDWGSLKSICLAGISLAPGNPTGFLRIGGVGGGEGGPKVVRLECWSGVGGGVGW